MSSVVDAALEGRYDRLLESVVGQRTRLSQELAIEDEYEQVVEKIIGDARADDELEFYRGPDAFAGGARNLELVLSGVHDMVADAAAAARLDPGPFICRLWPDPALNARAVRTEAGGVVLINTGLLVFLRLAAQFTAGSMAAITGKADEWGPDAEPPEVMTDQFIDRLRKYRAGMDVRQQLIVEVIRGPREAFRRLLNHFGVVYIVAHEVGHLVDKAEDATESLSLSAAVGPISEQDEVASQYYEMQADLTAYKIMREPPVGAPEPPAVVAMGPMLVSGIQSALWWMDRAGGSQDFGWSHPAPDVRIGGAVFELAPETRPRQHEIARQFATWMETVFGINRSQQEAQEREQ
jgi:hypothetical protein